MGEACAKGAKDRAGRVCPTEANVPETVEGTAVWAALKSPGVWTGGGMSPLRIDRAELSRRLSDIEPWILIDLLDAFEPAALAAIARASKTKTKPGKRPAEEE